MSMPLRQTVRLGTYLMKKKLQRDDKFALLVELEPLFACNLKCAGCGKIEQPASLLKQRMPVEQAVDAIQESGAPMVSIAGGEPLMHPQIDEIVRRLLDRNKIVFLCTNAVLLPKHLHKFKPHRNFAWMVHIDGLRERHDESVAKVGVFDQAVAAIKQAQAAGLPGHDQHDVLRHRHARRTSSRCSTSSTTTCTSTTCRSRPGTRTRRRLTRSTGSASSRRGSLFRKAFADGRRRKWRLNHSPVFLDFLEGKRDLGLHCLGHPVVLAARLAAALLPARRRLRRDLPGAARRHRLERRTAAAATPSARTAWRTAATSRPRCSPPWVRCGSRYGQQPAAESAEAPLELAVERAERRRAAGSAARASAGVPAGGGRDASSVDRRIGHPLGRHRTRETTVVRCSARGEEVGVDHARAAVCQR